MKMRSLGGDSNVDEVMTYLEKRHPLYFVDRKLSKDQVKDLVKKLIFKLNQKGVKATGSLASGTTTSKSSKPAQSAVKENDSFDPTSLSKPP